MSRKKIDYTPEGCEKARKVLRDELGWTDTQFDRLTGWEIIHEANKPRKSITGRTLHGCKVNFAR